MSDEQKEVIRLLFQKQFEAEVRRLEAQLAKLKETTNE